MTNEEYISNKFGCMRFIDSCRFLSSGLDAVVSPLQNENLKTLQ